MKHIISLLALSALSVPAFAMAPAPDKDQMAKIARIETQAKLQARFAALDNRFEAAKARLTPAQIATLQPYRNAVQVAWLNYGAPTDATGPFDVERFNAAEAGFNNKLASFGG